MHLIATIPGGWNPNDEGVFYVEQQPGDILFLSASDTEIKTANDAYRQLGDQYENLPSFRLANLTYFKQELTIDTYIDEVASEAKVIVLRLLGGKSYFSYLCEAFVEIAEERGIKVIFIPGYDQPDMELMELSNVPLALVNRYWQYCVAGGVHNLTEGLKLLLNEFFSFKLPLAGISEVPSMFLYHHKRGILKDFQPDSNQRQVLILSYRAHFLANNLQPLHALSEQLENHGVEPVVLMALSFRDENIGREIHQLLTRVNYEPEVIINTTGFAFNNFGDHANGFFDQLKKPVIQAIFASCNRQSWEEGQFGLPPTDVAMNIALPEVDGKIITTAISFKESTGKDKVTDSDIITYVPHDQGCEFVARFAAKWISLQRKENREKRVALIMPNYPNKNSRLANGVGLDTPASTVQIIKALQKAGYDTGDDIPKTDGELIELLTRYITNEPDSHLLKDAEVWIDEHTFFSYYNKVSEALREKIETQWGHPYDSPNYKTGKFTLPGFCLGNLFVSIQPGRGYNIDIQATYHSPDLAPPYDYLAYYFWVQHEFKADALIHIGKHGNLEWLPGKSVALSPESCFPAGILGAIPHFYPFIINDPGEGTQAKRRNQAIIIDHLIPPLTRADAYGDLLKLEQLIDEYYEAALLDPKRASFIKNNIEKLVKSTSLKTDLNSSADDIDELLEAIDGYLCELKEAQIRGGLHILGQVPQKEKLTDLMVALHRIPSSGLSGFTQALAQDLQLDFDPLNCSYEDTYGKDIEGVHCRTLGKAVERLETLAKKLLVGEWEIKPASLPKTMEVKSYLENVTLPKVHRTTEELDNLLTGLNGRYVPAGGSGAPTRGRLDVLPTGRNFYSVDVRTIPSPSAYELGKKSAQNLIDRYLQENGEFPTSIGVSVWGTATMRTGGDDIAQALALIGVAPIWEGANRRVKDFKVLSLLELKRPRVDVVLRISGFFRDAFPDTIALFNAAIDKVAHLDEPDSENPIRARYKKEKQDWISKGLPEAQAEERSLYRVFGSKPGAYGAGLQGVIDEQNWSTTEDLARVYMNWSGYAYYGKKNEGRSAHAVFESRLATIEVVMQNQDNREHDILDSDDYYQFQGGMAAAVQSQKGSQPEIYFGDHSRPENPRVKTLKEELLKVYRSRAINPKWIKGMQDHGYKGAFEMAATMDYLFAYDATTNLIEDFMYQGITEAYLFDEQNQEFIRKNNKWALKDMSERMLEAIQRGMWQNPDDQTVEQLKKIYLESESDIE
ncbi:cobaltochelatase subunit CobN [Fulvivirga kasyanovii]|uniref:Cobaltochelatase subunit CobN n=1 Tax=Fulvivirga kasyanovii TaxID=396812 RepID=A0ABW9RS06_9BACT|nr:cobaltochelatase subunit CobN [Fulvivirga kasyanovii]MTI26486.1 cobaltochelatase subunit CobN [Fulvivirga kasyanovii]